MLSWTATRGGDPGFFLLHYEDLRKDPRIERAKVVAFLGLNISAERLDRSVELSGATRMRELEKQQHERWLTTRGTRPDIPFVGNGVIGGWKSVLSPSSVRQIESVCGSVMVPLGYPLSTQALTPLPQPNSVAASA